MAPLLPPVSRALYRYLLRASRFGQHPEVFGPYGIDASSAYFDGDGTKFPASGAETRRVLRHALAPPSGDDDYDTPDPFAVLRHAKTTASVLCPTALPKEMPIFDYGPAAGLPGEELMFNFFEPRYLALARMALATRTGPTGDTAPARDHGGGYFVLRATVGASLLRIVEHAPLPGGTVGVRCAVGPRVHVRSERPVDIVAVDPQNQKTNMPPLAVSIAVDLPRDDDAAATTTDATRRAHVLALLSQVTKLEDVVRRTGLPPLSDTDFSFWALRSVLADDDVASRQKWSFVCWNAEERLDYVQGRLNAAVRAGDGATKGEEGSPEEGRL